MNDSHDVFPNFGRFLLWVAVMSVVGIGAVLLLSRHYEKTMCARAAENPVQAHRDVLRDCQIPDPLGR